MLPVVQSLPVLAVSAIYCLWHTYCGWELRRRERELRQRVAYMLWVMAEKVG
jgi:hypothetical protein